MSGFKGLLAVLSVGGMLTVGPLSAAGHKRHRTQPRDTGTANRQARDETDYTSRASRDGSIESRINRPRRENSVQDAIRFERYKQRAAEMQARKEARRERSSASREQ